MKVPFVHSNFERVEGDYYPTIDERCIDGFLQHFQPEYKIVDVCAPDGSGIVDTLVKRGYSALCRSDAFESMDFYQWIVTNPPYTRGLVDDIINRQISRLEDGQADNLAVLVRSGFDFAKGRAGMFSHPYYAGQIKLTFRPWWSENRTAQPIHNYAWQVWNRRQSDAPRIWYADGKRAEVERGQ